MLRFDLDLIGLHLPQIKLAGADELLMHQLAVVTRPQTPTAHGPLVQTKSGNDGLNGTTVGQQGDHQHNHLTTGLDAIQQRAPCGTEGLATACASVPLFLLAVDHDIACTRFAPRRAVLVWAELLSGVHLASHLASWSKQVCERTPFLTRPRYSAVLPKIRQMGAKLKI